MGMLVIILTGDRLSPTGGEMKTRGLNLLDWQVRAVLDGRKTRHTVPVNPQPDFDETKYEHSFWMPDYDVPSDWIFMHRRANGIIYPLDGSAIECPFGVVGDRLWVRETYTTAERIWDGDSCRSFMVPGIVRGGSFFRYRADGEIDDARWRPSIHMPRWASRITLEITKVKVERVNDITRDDAIAEGCCAFEDNAGWYGPEVALAALWDSIYAKRGFGWDSNPWVWVIEFRRVEQ